MKDEPVARFASGVNTVTRPSVTLWRFNDSCFHRIRFHIPQAVQPVPFVLDCLRPVSAIPECTAPAVLAIEVTRVLAEKISHRVWQRLLCPRRDDKMIVIAHQRKCVNIDTVVGHRFSRLQEKTAVVDVDCEDLRAVMTALVDVVAHAGGEDSRTSWHRWAGRRQSKFRTGGNLARNRRNDEERLKTSQNLPTSRTRLVAARGKTRAWPRSDPGLTL
jgi:hypothetical protein